jgi:hypothetical protein
MENIKVGNKVGWSSAAGYLEGYVRNIVISKNAANQLVPWIDIEYPTAPWKTSTTRLCATDSNLKMMKVSPVQ